MSNTYRDLIAELADGLTGQRYTSFRAPAMSPSGISRRESSTSCWRDEMRPVGDRVRTSVERIFAEEAWPGRPLPGFEVWWEDIGTGRSQGGDVAEVVGIRLARWAPKTVLGRHHCRRHHRSGAARRPLRQVRAHAVVSAAAASIGNGQGACVGRVSAATLVSGLPTGRPRQGTLKPLAGRSAWSLSL